MKSSILLTLAQLLISAGIIYKVSYTEIDWKAYMQQVEGFLEGERDYFELRGDTGPLVYPAGFLYIFTALHSLTNRGRDILIAQGIFALFQAVTVFIVSKLMGMSAKVPNIVMLLLLFSKRIQSIYVLRLFNDPVGMMFMYGSIYAMVKKKWELSAVLFSMSLSIKMNVLLFAPGYALLFYQGTGIFRSILNAALFIGVQGLIGYPFLVANPEHYLRKSFEFSRQFFYQWTVNWRMISKDYFESKDFSIMLLASHMICLLIFFFFVWSRSFGGLKNTLTRATKSKIQVDGESFSNLDILLILFSSNFIGVVFARSLHYQFYSWYFYALPYLLWRTRFPLLVRLLIFGSIELCWSVYPSTTESSSLLLGCHVLVLLGLFVGDERPINGKMKIN